MLDNFKIRKEVAELLKLEIEILCDTLRGAAYNTVWEDDPEFADLVTHILNRALSTK